MRSLPLRLMLLVLTVAAAVPLASTPLAAQSAFRLYFPLLGQPGIVVLATDRDSGSAVISIDVASATERILTGPSTNDMAPTPSPDGRLIGFFSTRDGANAAYVMERDGTNQRKLADCNICLRLLWSPNSRQVLLSEQFSGFDPVSGPRNIVETQRLSLDGALPTQTYPGYAVWSPDGRWIAFADRENERPVLVISATDGPQRSSIPLAGLNAESLRWSPDSSRLAFQLYNANDGYVVHALERSGGPARRLGIGKLPSWSPDSNRLAFLEQQTASDVAKLSLVNADGSGKLSLGGAAIAEPAWSPDGSQLAVGQDGAKPQVLIVSSTGDVRRQFALAGRPDGMLWAASGGQLAINSSDGLYLAGPGNELRSLGAAGAVAWSTDGRQLLIARSVLRSPVIYSTAYGVEALTPLTSGGMPALTPGGRGLAFSDGGDLYTIGTDGTGRRRLTTGLNLLSAPAWSPNGTMLAFSAQAGASVGVYLIGADGTGLRQVMACPSIYDCGRPDWSPDGTSIAFGAEGVFVAAVARGVPRRLHDGAQPAWSPDGQRIAFVRTGQIRLIGADGTGERLLAAPADFESSYSEPQWSDDGQQLLAMISGIIAGKVAFAEAVVLDAGNGAELERWLGWAPRWSANGARIAYLHSEPYGFYELYYYSLSSSYTKLCLADGPAAGCGGLPQGHGNVLDYDLSP